MRVVIAGDHPLFRDGLRSLLEARGIDVIGESTNGREAVEHARRRPPRPSFAACWIQHLTAW
jgi:DNA-binding NarL/FixJ family response regulator